MRPSDVDVNLVSSYDGWPVMHGHNSGYSGDNSNNNTMRWLSVTTGRDGLLHFGAAQESTGNQSSHYYSNFQASMSYNEYFITYNPADGSWGLTGRKCDDSTLPDGRDDFGVWLPINTMSVSDYASEADIDVSTFNGVANSRTFKTWMFLGGRTQQVQGIESGSPQSKVTADFRDAWELYRTDGVHTPEESIQSMWLDEEHFIVFSWVSVQANNQATAYLDNLVYTIYRYFDENKIEIISHGSVRSQDDSEGQIQQYVGGNIFRRYSPGMLMSDRYADTLVTLSAGQAPSDSDGA